MAKNSHPKKLAATVDINQIEEDRGLFSGTVQQQLVNKLQRQKMGVQAPGWHSG